MHRAIVKITNRSGIMIQDTDVSCFRNAQNPRNIVRLLTPSSFPSLTFPSLERTSSHILASAFVRLCQLWSLTPTDAHALSQIRAVTAL